MAKSEKKNPTPALTLEELKAAMHTAEEAAKQAIDANAAAQLEAEKPDASEETKKAAETANAAAEAAVSAFEQAVSAYEEAQAAADQAAADQAAADQAAADQAAADQADADQAAADPEDDPAYVPIFRDEEGDRIPRNSKIRIKTTTGTNLRSLDGVLITPEPVVDLHGPDVRKGDWYTVQFQAGLIEVDGVKRIK